MQRLRTAQSYLQAIPRIIVLQVLSKTALGAMLSALDRVATWTLKIEGRVAVTTGDFKFLFSSVPGLLLLVLALITLYLYVAVDINMMIAFAGHWVRGERFTLRQVFRESAAALKHYMSWDGLLVVLYIALLAPILGVGASLSITSGLRIPSFISSVIESTPLYRTAYRAFLIVFSLIGYLYIFIVYGVVLDNLSVTQARRRSSEMMRRNWRDFIKQNLLFILTVSVLLMLALTIMVFVTLKGYTLVIDNREMLLELSPDFDLVRFLTLLLLMLLIAFTTGIVLLGAPFMSIKMTKLYLTYTTGTEPKVARHKYRYVAVPVLWALAAVLVSTGFAYGATQNFDLIFPQESSVQVIAHRACGVEGMENSVSGLPIAEAAGAWAAEIDIQRTSDGAYVVNHDADFSRVANDPHTPHELTLEEVRRLKLQANPADPHAPAEQVSTYEEMLDGAIKHNLVLLVELKGETADHQMADDAVRIAREHKAFDQCVFISLEYELIDYLEDNWPEAKTGFLAFASYGDTAALKCDYLALEELAATSGIIDAIHDQGKKVLVWTVNDRDSQKHFLNSKVDGIITDNMTQAEEIKDEMAARDDFTRILDGITG